jgi:hypothetical protein
MLIEDFRNDKITLIEFLSTKNQLGFYQNKTQSMSRFTDLIRVYFSNFNLKKNLFSFIEISKFVIYEV